MASSAPRRSTRERKSNTLYNDQVPWTDETVRMLRAASDSPDRSSSSATPESVQEVEDEEFNTLQPRTAGHEQDDEDEDEDQYEDDEDLDLDLDPSTKAVDESSSDDAESVPPPKPNNYAAVFKTGVERYSIKPQGQPIVFPRPKAREWAKEQGVRNRMLSQDKEPMKSSMKTAYPDTFGPALEDLYPVLQSRDLWYMRIRDLVLPSRASIHDAFDLQMKGKYLKVTPSTILDNNCQQPRIQGDSLSNAYNGHRRAITLEEAISRSFIQNDCRNDAILGPWDQSRKFELMPSAATNISEAYSKHTQPQADEATEPPAHRGWLINLGARIQSMTWAPSKSNEQFLAVAFNSTSQQRRTAAPTLANTAPAFTPSPLCPSHIQVLRVISASFEEHQAAKLSHISEDGPQLYQVLCMRWGTTIQLEWLLPTIGTEAEDMTKALVALSSDGKIRVLVTDLKDKYIGEITRPNRIASPSFSTMLTCFCLPSAKDLIAGDTVGNVHLYNLNQCSPTGELSAYATCSIHNTYIMSLTVASDQPHVLCSQSAAGEIILSDLRSPTQDRVAIRKSRLPTRNLAYYPFTRTFITAADSIGSSESTGSSLSLVVGLNMRHFYRTSLLLKLPECSGVITVLATSKFHPIVLVANASGTVFAGNLMKRLLPITKSEEKKALTWMVKIWEVEWLRSSRDLDGAAMEQHDAMDLDIQPELEVPLNGDKPLNPKRAADLYHGHEPYPGVTRFHEGFKSVRAEVTNHAGQSKSNTASTKAKAGGTATSQIIMPEEQAVTAMAWNPNGRFSGWAAIALGSGVLCIKDLSHDNIE